jgi:chemosensory pili system protein ChpA (sensor histidine kinase/response regulator)
MKRELHRVLVVDDDDEIREVLREVLLTAGYAAETAPNGQEALDRLMRASLVPDVVVLDLDMPVLDGAGLYRLMRQEPKLVSIPIVVSTGMPAAAPAGARVLPKPVDVPHLLETVAELCGDEPSERGGRLDR